MDSLTIADKKVFDLIYRVSCMDSLTIADKKVFDLIDRVESLQLHKPGGKGHVQKRHGARAKGGTASMATDLDGNPIAPVKPAFSDKTKIGKTIAGVQPQVEALAALENSKPYQNSIKKRDTALDVMQRTQIDALSRANGEANGFKYKKGDTAKDKEKIFAKAEKDYLKANDEIANQVIKAAGFPKGNSVLVEGRTGLDKHDSKIGNQAAAHVGKLSPNSTTTVDFYNPGDLARGRASAAGAQEVGVNKTLITAPTRSGYRTYVHELGHAVEQNWGRGGEASLTNRGAASRAFVAKRVGNEKVRSMNSVSNKAYFGDHERGRKDKFDRAWSTAESRTEAKKSAYYTGKDYKDVIQSRPTTEVVSMGTELLFRNPAGFARTDPEWAGFTLAVHRGDFD